MKKKFISLLLCLCVIFPVCLVHVNAKTTTIYPDEYYEQQVSISEQTKQLLNNPYFTSEQRQRIIERANHALSAMSSEYQASSSVQIPRAAPALYVPFCNQETWYYCGPATTRQTYLYLNNKINGSFTAPTQSQLASALGTNSNTGTDLALMTNYINQAFNLDYLEIWWWSSAASMAECIHQAISEDERPPMLCITVPAGNLGSWPFDTSGHYVNISGYTTTGQYIIVDPYFDGHSIPSGTYQVPMSEIFRCEDRMSY